MVCYFNEPLLCLINKGGGGGLVLIVGSRILRGWWEYGEFNEREFNANFSLNFSFAFIDGVYLLEKDGSS